ncbi:5-methyltetrahydropteroyltriglutamate--homocysteine S-methyltransferase [Siphonobacter sp.]|uniref:5-methyltetrahydropteroyltriglutamate-- homocysteine S-methyltransferase n=1 Tax=Siphonobacter sp. TaxID=1869184 RepID=UPI003B3AB8AF
MVTHNLGYPRVGSKRELKWASEQFWAGKISKDELLWAGRQVRRQNWQTQQEAGIQWIPSNDFSYYDQVLDTALMVGAVPERYQSLIDGKSNRELEIYFAMARGIQQNGLDIKAMEMTKWFDTNYHFIVPEFLKNQQFKRYSDKVIHDFEDAKQMGILTKPVLLGPVSFLLLGKEKEAGFHRIDLLERLLPVYADVLRELATRGTTWVQLDEPCLTLDLSENEQIAFQQAYEYLARAVPQLSLLVATYFESIQPNLALTLQLPVAALHVDLVRGNEQLEVILADTSFVASQRILSLGVVDGRNVWKNDFTQSLTLIQRAVEVLGKDRVWIAPSCSLLHVPYDLDSEKNEAVLTPEIKNWMAFAKQKLGEVVTLGRLAKGEAQALLLENQAALESRRTSSLIHKSPVKTRVQAVQSDDFERDSAFAIRQQIQGESLQLPLFPTTTIGSFPQTDEVRQWRAKYKKGEVTQAEYEAFVEAEIEKSIRWQEEVGLDVLVHGEFERNDMVEYFGEQLTGYVFTQNGWVQSYGSRCVKPPIIYGDVERPEAMTVRWTTFAQSKTEKYMKGMLTGPVTIMQWSFVRDDQPRKDTAFQIALAIRDEVQELEQAGIRIIQIDEPAIREGLPLRRADWGAYLTWAVDAFRLSASGVADQTQIHTHMCYSEFNDIMEAIARMDADVITIETSRSQMELLEAFSDFQYPNEIGPGVYDIHSPRVPSVEEMAHLLEKALRTIPARNLWVNPDCGLKTRRWAETDQALRNMVAAARQLQQTIRV